ncbi:MAG: 3-methyl-2-oxobutanoate hydroxymethyltransferase [Thermoguttaceae bacterium]|jgi:3-methyl-2-oxobutanoate hydroxymethyltransferase|nr:3-methyl-2-oxobutanoate hydroxymethyltransferase [Thermoguttaceae bacterium]
MATKSGALSVTKILKMKESGEKIAMVTAYDFPTAQMADAAGLDVVLIGDSVGTVVQGRATTLGVTLDDMIYHAEMTARGVKRALVVVDLPFPYCQLGPDEAIRACARILKETEAAAVKIEGGASRAETVRAVVEAGIPVVGHCGLAPQSVKATGGYRIQRDVDRLLADCLAIEEAGAFAVVLECVQRDYAEEVTKKLRIPTIGIGSGVGCDGQVLVFHDLFNYAAKDPSETPKHARVYCDLRKLVDQGFRDYVADVKSGAFPGDAESFGAKK